MRCRLPAVVSRGRGLCVCVYIPGGLETEPFSEELQLGVSPLPSPPSPRPSQFCGAGYMCPSSPGVSLWSWVAWPGTAALRRGRHPQDLC